MCAHIQILFDMVQRQTDKSNEQKVKDWAKIFTTVSRQVTLRVVSCIQIASKAHCFALVKFFTQSNFLFISKTLTKPLQAMNVAKARLCLQSLGFAYTDDAIRKSELRVLTAVGFVVGDRSTPLAYIESFLDVLCKILWSHGFEVLNKLNKFWSADQFLQTKWTTIWTSMWPPSGSSVCSFLTVCSSTWTSSTSAFCALRTAKRPTMSHGQSILSFIFISVFRIWNFCIFSNVYLKETHSSHWGGLRAVGGWRDNRSEHLHPWTRLHQHHCVYASAVRARSRLGHLGPGYLALQLENSTIFETIP